MVRRAVVRGQWPGRALVSGQRPLVSAFVLAALAVLPLLVPEVWAGFRLGLSDATRSVIAPSEQPLSVRSPGGAWAMCLAVVWFCLAYARRRFRWWEAVLVVIGGVAVLARLGNGWLDAAMMVVPLARQLSFATFKPRVRGVLGALCVAVGLFTLATSRPPDLPPAARRAALSAAPRGTVLADWRWAGELQQPMGSNRVVLASGGLASESSEFWLDYVRVAQGHEHWAEILSQMNVDLVVLDSGAQQRQAADLVRGSSDWHVTFDAQDVLVAERIGS